MYIDGIISVTGGAAFSIGEWWWGKCTRPNMDDSPYIWDMARYVPYMVSEHMYGWFIMMFYVLWVIQRKTWLGMHTFCALLCRHLCHEAADVYERVLCSQNDETHGHINNDDQSILLMAEHSYGKPTVFPWSFPSDPKHPGVHSYVSLLRASLLRPGEPSKPVAPWNLTFSAGEVSNMVACSKDACGQNNLGLFIEGDVLT